MENECQFCGDPAVAELCETCLNDDTPIGEHMSEYKEKMLVIPDVEDQFQELSDRNNELLKDLNYWRNQAFTLRERNVVLEAANKMMDEIINEEWPL